MNRRRLTGHRAAPITPPLSEIQYYAFNATPAGGSYRLRLGESGDWSPYLNWDADSAQITGAIEAIAGIGTGNVVATRSGNTVTVDFSGGSLAGTNVTQLTHYDNTLIAAIGAPSLTVLTEGSLANCTFPDGTSYFTDGNDVDLPAEQFDGCTPPAMQGTYSFDGNTYQYDQWQAPSGWEALGRPSEGGVYIQKSAVTSGQSPFASANIDLKYGDRHYFFVSLPAGANAGKYYLVEGSFQRGPEFAYNASAATIQAALSHPGDYVVTAPSATLRNFQANNIGTAAWSVHDSPTEPLKRTITISHGTTQEGG